MLSQVSTGRPRRLAHSRTIWMAAAAAVIVMFAVGMWYFPQFNKQAEIIAQNEMVVIKGKDYVRLPDGTRVTLKEGSELTYNSRTFGDTTREVTLKGQGYFDVGFDTKRPFKVWTGKIVTTVHGTAFNISVTGTDKVTITVSRGKVSVGDVSTVYGTLIPNEQIAVDTRSNQYVKSVINAEAVTAWKDKYFILDEVTFTDAAELIEKRFNVNVTVDNKALNKCVISAWFLNNESLEQIIESISVMQQATYTITEGNVTIEGGKGCG
jgi:transmembrane sensor